jgi:regulatory protein YycI of two-component signal transduction system YycFG
MKTVIFILALFIVNMMLSTYAFTDEQTKANQDPYAANFQL